MQKLHSNSDSILIENKFTDIFNSNSETVCTYENSNITMIRCFFSNISSYRKSPCIFSNNCIFFMQQNSFSTCIGNNGENAVYSNCYEHHLSKNLTMNENCLYLCSPEAKKGCDSSIFVDRCKTFWRCHNSSNNGGVAGGAFCCIENSDDADVKFIIVTNPKDAHCMVNHPTNNVSSLIVVNAHMVYHSIFWISTALYMSDSLILNCQSRNLYGLSTNHITTRTYIEKENGIIVAKFMTKYEYCHNIFEGNVQESCDANDYGPYGHPSFIGFQIFTLIFDIL